MRGINMREINMGALESLSLARAAAAAALLAAITLGACQRQNSVQINFQMGEKVTAGAMTYTVVQAAWRAQLGESFNVRTPQDRFLVITLSATNGGSREVSLPFATLEGPGGKVYREIEQAPGVENWFGLLRNLQGSETRQGNLVFDVPLTSYRLRLTDGGEPGVEKSVWVEIPLHIDTDSSVPAPVPGER